MEFSAHKTKEILSGLRSLIGVQGGSEGLQLESGPIKVSKRLFLVGSAASFGIGLVVTIVGFYQGQTGVMGTGGLIMSVGAGLALQRTLKLSLWGIEMTLCSEQLREVASAHADQAGFSAQQKAELLRELAEAYPKGATLVVRSTGTVYVEKTETRETTVILDRAPLVAARKIMRGLPASREKVYKPKDEAPESGIYNVVAADSVVLNRRITMEEGSQFPPLMGSAEYGYILHIKMPKAYKPRERAPESGIYNVVGADRTFLKRQVIMEEGNQFPPLRSNTKEYGYMLHIEAVHLPSPVLYRPGDRVPYSGIYGLVDENGAYLNHQMVFSMGGRFTRPRIPGSRGYALHHVAVY